jgi:transcriptional regulator with XRE-family HTH domain
MQRLPSGLHGMQQRFDEWLEEKLNERGWQAADLARASRTPDYPRGFDPGLISRWRKPPPLGVVPRMETANRLAVALRVPLSEVYAAIGRLPPAGERPDSLEATDESVLATRAITAEMSDILRGLPRVYWGTVIKAFTRGVEGARDMAQLLAERPSQSPITSAGESRITNHVAASNEAETEPSGHLPLLQQGRRYQFAGAAV